MRILLFVLLTLGITGCATNAVTGKQSINFMSSADQIAMGEQNYRPYQQQQGGRYTVDPHVDDYVKSIGKKLAAVSDQPNLPYDFVVLNDDTPNAWALPGGKIAVNRGLLVLLDDEAQLAAVLGHEIVHAAAGHTAQQQSKATLMGIGAALLTLAVSDSEYSPLVGAGVGVGVGMTVAKFGREQELESDNYGIKYMAKAGYDVQAAVELQEKFVALSKGQASGGLSTLFASHPPSQERVEKNRQKLAQYPGGVRNKSQFERAMGQIRRDAAAYKLNQDAQKAAANKQYDEGLSLVNKAIGQQGREAQFHITKGRILLAKDDTVNASNAFRRATQENPSYVMGFLYHGMTEKKLGYADTAERSFKRSMDLLPTPIAAYYLGDMSREHGDRANARRYFEFAAQDQGDIGQAARRQLQNLN
ncbi:MAG TPA: M48 family metalloprotease [Cellvibrionaceae bacterium]